MEQEINEVLKGYPTYCEGITGGSKTGNGSAAFIWRAVGYLIQTGVIDLYRDDNETAKDKVRKLAETVPGVPFIKKNMQEVANAVFGNHGI